MRVLLTGDSIIARYEGKPEPHINWNLKQILPEIQIENTAVSGINSGAFFARLNELVLSVKKCDNLVILLGTNDLATHKQVPLEQFKRNMQLIASAVICQYYPPHVLLISPPAVDEKKQHVRNNKLVEKYAGVVKKVADEYHFRYANLCQAMIDADDLSMISRGIKNDGLHFGDKGYEILGNLISSELKKM
ncbi:esterase [Lactobacillus helveticus]|uniref:Esterase n=2 Tax=Lactobacillus helveticus TaxID=1587 RepID=A0A0D5MGG4_LACHE|nr:SGNH/GDSL hydrolase family protein [Lactobacillus helveticus]EGF39728.1 putative esterase [Lactobacillus helveticus MTCC 5463]AGQ22678.1 putative esterase [Lactobacillus helveticus CNRZ32]AHI11075.1 GDSL-like lipase/acylhydrolase [Lactobacillus helveticus H9]AJY60688.1 esterase [Lactobacillus helveticus]AKG65954.1 esterase [Lactobacillus helveticus]